MDPAVLDAISQLSSLDISVKEIGLRKLIKICQSEVSRSTFDLSAYGVHIIIVHMLIPSTDVVAMLFMQLLNLLAIEKHRRPKISTNDVIKFLYDNLHKSIQDQNDMLLERTLSLFCSITLENEGAVELLSKKDSPFYLFGTFIDLINYDNIRIKTLAVTTVQNFIQPVKADISGKNLFVKGNHSLFCHRQGFDNVIRYINGVSESGGVFDEYVVASLRLMTAFTSPNGFGTEDTLKRIIVAAGALQPICQKFTMSDKVRDYSIILLYSLSSTLQWTKKSFIDNGIVSVILNAILQELPLNMKYVLARLVTNLVEAGIVDDFKSTGLSSFVADSINMPDYRSSEAMIKLTGILALDDFMRTELIDNKAEKQLAEVSRRAQITCPKELLDSLLRSIETARNNLMIPISSARKKAIEKFYKNKYEQKKREKYLTMVEERQRTGSKWTLGVSAGSKSGGGSSKMSESMLQKIGHIAREIVMTEKSYIESLDKCMKYYYNELASPNSACPLSQEEIKKLFGNLPEIIEINRPLLKLMDEKIKIDEGKIPFGEVFIEYFTEKMIHVYTEYTINLDGALDTYYKMMATNDPFKAFVNKKKQELNLDMASFIVMPVQRIPRYILLLKTLSSKIPSLHSEATKLGIAFVRAKEVADIINERKRQAENANKIIQLSESIEGLPPGFQLIIEGRIFVKQGIVILVTQESSGSECRTLILLSDIMILAIQCGRTFKLVEMINLVDIDVEPIDTEDGNLTDSFRVLIPSSNRVLTMTSSSPIERDQWIESIEKQVKLQKLGRKF